MIRFGRRLIPDTLAEIVEPARTLLLVWDMQPDILNSTTDPAGVTANVTAVRDAARRAGVAISYSQQTAVPLEHETAVWIRARMRQAGVDAPEKIPLRLQPGTPGWSIVPACAPGPGEHVFIKHRPNAFEGTSFELHCRNLVVGTLVLAGVTTDIGIEATARIALAKGFYVVVVRDAVASRQADAHERSLAFLQRTVDVTTAAELVRIWSA